MADQFVTMHICRRFPKVRPGTITRLRGSVVNNGTLAHIALTSLELDQHLIQNSPALADALVVARAEMAAMPLQQLDRYGWLVDHPKPLADAFEAIVGAVFIDARADMDVVYGVLERVLQPALEQLTVDMPADPPSRLLQLQQRMGCRDFRLSCVTAQA